MRGLDTNVLVRYLVRDDKRQADKASDYIHEVTSRGEPLFINGMVLCEFVWVLESCYSFQKKEIVNVLERILVTKQFEFERKDIVRQSLNDYTHGKGDLADYLIGRINHEQGCAHTATFDRALKSESPFQWLS